MKKIFVLFGVFFLVAGMLWAQNPGEALWQLSADLAVKGLAQDLNRIISGERAANVAVDEFSYEGMRPPLSQYLSSQIVEELATLSGPYIVFPELVQNAASIISGEIVDLADSIRVFARVSRAADRSVIAAFHVDLDRSESILQMLSTGDNRRRPLVARDAWEIDSWDNPVPCEIGSDESAVFMDRTLHSSDEDFFLLVPDVSKRLVAETSGGIDTYMELFNADTRELLAENDDGGSGTNARISHDVEAGKRYIVKVRGYSDTTGSYGFRGYYHEVISLPPDEYEPDNTFSAAKWITVGIPQTRTFHDGNDLDWVKFQAAQRGQYLIRARGVNSNRLDTYVELYTDDRDLIDEDDDGGDYYDSRLSVSLEAGVYYLKIGCFGDEPDQAYILSVEIE